jgi:hypothetical protein
LQLVDAVILKRCINCLDRCIWHCHAREDQPPLSPRPPESLRVPIFASGVEPFIYGFIIEPGIRGMRTTGIDVRLGARSRSVDASRLMSPASGSGPYCNGRDALSCAGAQKFNPRQRFDQAPSA